jgi:hypothetical protein
MAAAILVSNASPAVPSPAPHPPLDQGIAFPTKAAPGGSLGLQASLGVLLSRSALSSTGTSAAARLTGAMHLDGCNAPCRVVWRFGTVMICCNASGWEQCVKCTVTSTMHLSVLHCTTIRTVLSPGYQNQLHDKQGCHSLDVHNRAEVMSTAHTAATVPAELSWVHP